MPRSKKSAKQEVSGGNPALVTSAEVDVKPAAREERLAAGSVTTTEQAAPVSESTQGDVVYSLTPLQHAETGLKQLEAEGDQYKPETIAAMNGFKKAIKWLLEVEKARNGA